MYITLNEIGNTPPTLVTKIECIESFSFKQSLIFIHFRQKRTGIDRFKLSGMQILKVKIYQ